MRLKFILSLIALAVLCMPVVGQTTATDWIKEGDALHNQSKHDEAVKAYDKAIELDPQSEEAWTKKGVALFGSESATADDSMRCFDNAILINPNCADAWYQKGSWLKHLASSEYIYGKDTYGDLRAQEALNCFDEVTRIESNNTKALGEKGDTLEFLGMYTDALLCYDRIIGIDPNDNMTCYEAWSDKADIYMKLKNYELAIACYDQAINAYSGDKNRVLYQLLFVDKANALLKLGRTAEANTTFAKAVELGYLS